MNKVRATGIGESNGKDYGTPTDEKYADGQYKDHFILSEEERSKGVVRPVRRSYVHVGIPSPNNLRDLTEEEKERYSQYGYIAYEEYPENEGIVGRYWTKEQIDKIGVGCGTITKMGLAIAETFARDPSFYGSTFCSGCGKYFPVGNGGEFVWLDDRTRVGT